MEENKWILITIAAYFVALIYDLLKRDKESSMSPKKFDILFYLKDNRARLILSLFMSCIMAWLFWILFPDLMVMDEKIYSWGIFVYLVIGAAPDLIIAYSKRKTNFLRPEEVEGYKRRNETSTVNPTKPGGPKT